MEEKKKGKRPSYSWYPKDVLTDSNVQLMTSAQEGAYRRLLDISWLEKGIPMDENKVLHLCKRDITIEDVRIIMKRFTINPKYPGKLVNERQEQERKAKEEWSAKSSGGGKKGAETRWKKKKQPSPPIEKPVEVKISLHQECEPYKAQYGEKLIKEFLNYWTEKFRKGKKVGKERWEAEDTWETGKRLATWYNNSLKFNKGTFDQPEVKSNVLPGTIGKRYGQ